MQVVVEEKEGILGVEKERFNPRLVVKGFTEVEGIK